jgi:hypothetical protein
MNTFAFFNSKSSSSNGIAVAALLLAIATASAPAHARHHKGFIANAVAAVTGDKKLADKLDDVNQKSGHPIERAAVTVTSVASAPAGAILAAGFALDE